jgi:biopolymer transport protein ExbD
MKSKLKTNAGPAGEVSFNVVPLVDVAFLLILFFILTSQIASASYASMLLPKPDASQAIKAVDNPNRVIVNVVSKINPADKHADPRLSIQADKYQVGPNPIAIGETAALQRELRTKKQECKDKGLPENEFFVEVRADKRVAFLYIQPVLMAASQEGIPRMKITALAEAGATAAK